jgi:transposase
MGHTPRPAPAAGVGIDVSQHTLAACLLPADGGRPRFGVFANDPAGQAALGTWADRHAAGAPLSFCLEGAGAYGGALARALAGAGRHVSVANPARVKYAGLMSGRGNKTDRADARLIAGTPPANARPPGSRPARKSADYRP